MIVKSFVVYNGSGKILRTGAVSVDDDLGLQVRDGGEFVIEGEASDLDNCVDVTTKTIVPAPEIRAAHDARERAAKDAVGEKIQQLRSALLDIISTTNSPHIKFLARIELERL